MDGWYLKLDETVLGPLSAAELKERAESGDILPDTMVQSPNGKWVEARRIRGLIRDLPPSLTSPTDKVDPFEAAKMENEEKVLAETAHIPLPSRPPILRSGWSRKRFFDLEFRDFATPRLIVILYALSIILLFFVPTIYVLFAFIEADKQSDQHIPMYAIGYWVGGVISLIVVRVSLEAVIVVFRIHDSLERLEQLADAISNRVAAKARR